MAALDLLGRRWSLRILWELRDGPLGFRALQAACDGMSSSVLRDRLAELVDAGLVGRDDDAYALTPLGTDLRDALTPLTRWAERWDRQLRQAGAASRSPRNAARRATEERA
jgi:DNA-binding HxlR family transcriptional regulator